MEESSTADGTDCDSVCSVPLGGTPHARVQSWTKRTDRVISEVRGIASVGKRTSVLARVFLNA